MPGQPKSAVKVVFGSMTLGAEGAEQARVHDLQDCAKILDVFQEFGHSEVDTARMYGGGSCEEYLSKLDLSRRGLTLATKLAPTMVNSQGTHGHGAQSLRQGLLDSLEALKVEKLDMWYLHAPDHDTDYEETLREVNNLYKEGRFHRFGLSNFSAWETARICEIAIRNGWKKPDVYQGVYNALHRAVEPELLPCLRYYDISFYAYNPLAGGILTDRYQRKTAQHDEGSRFDPNRRQGAEYRNRYWDDNYFDALDLVRPTAAQLGMSTAEAALRWCVHHGFLEKDCGDAVIVGASSAKQMRENLENLDKGPLPEEMVQAFDEGWAKVKGICKPYYR